MLHRLAAFAPPSRLQRLKVLESARPLVCSLHAPFAKSAFRNVNTWSENGRRSFLSSIGSSGSLSSKGGGLYEFFVPDVPWNGEALVTPDHIKKIRGLAFEKVYLVTKELYVTTKGVRVPVPKELHVAVVLASGNDCLFGEQGHNCLRIEFDREGLSLSAMKQGHFDRIKKSSIEPREEHLCHGKQVAEVLHLWNDPAYEYDPRHRNCIHFAGALLEGIGIKSEKLPKLQRKVQFWLSCPEAVQAASSVETVWVEKIIQLKRKHAMAWRPMMVPQFPCR